MTLRIVVQCVNQVRYPVPIRTQDRAAPSESLYRLSCPGSFVRPRVFFYVYIPDDDSYEPKLVGDK